jgi:hypothetical protein
MSVDLKTTAELALATARLQMERTQTMAVRAGIVVESELKWIQLPTALAPIMNDPRMKDVFFGFLRSAARELHASAIVVVTDAWVGIATEKQRRMARENPKELERLIKSHSVQGSADLGLCTKAEAIIITVHTPESVYSLQQQYARTGNGGILWEERTDYTTPQDEWGGRMKLFGEDVLQ